MQSVLQFRRFRATVEAQLARDQARAESFRAQPRHKRRSSRASISSDDSKHDLEKGIDHGDFADQHQQRPTAIDLAAESEKEQEEEMAAEQGRFQEPVEETPKAEEGDDSGDEGADLSANRTITRTTTQMSAGNALGTILTGVEVRRRTTKEGGDGNVFVVNYEGADDPNDPQ